MYREERARYQVACGDRPWRYFQAGITIHIGTSFCVPIDFFFLNEGYKQEWQSLLLSCSFN